MNCCRYPCREELGDILSRVGVYRWGIAEARPVAKEVSDSYESWIRTGSNGTMGYLDRYHDVRCDPRLLLDGAKSVVSCVFSYFTGRSQPFGSPRIAMYALGEDYHEVIRRRLSAAADEMKARWGGETRVCVDTAPIFERYWAQQAGVGMIGRNRQLIVPGSGSFFFIAEILTTLRLEPDAPCRLDCGDCGDCGECVRACPGGALLPDGGFDARKCLSYLTIEHKGPLPDNLDLGMNLYGCDTCQAVCPHNSCPPVSAIEEFHPTEAILSLTEETVASMTQSEFSALFRHSAIKRTKLAGLQRNLGYLKRGNDKKG